MAAEWSVSADHHGYINHYVIHPEGLKILDLNQYTILSWLAVLLENRTFDVETMLAKEAKQYIEDYFKTYKGIKTYLDNCVNTAKENGYVTTLYKRRRPIPELASSNFMTRSFGERVAMNSPIQGTAADIMKIAMINVYNALKDNNLDAKIIVQVHDELLIEVSEKDLEAARVVLYEEMKNAAKLNVNLEVDIHDGKDWYEAK